MAGPVLACAHENDVRRDSGIRRPRPGLLHRDRPGRPMKRFLKNNGLTVFFAGIFLLALTGQALTGHADHNNALITDGADPIPLLRYLTSSDFAVDVAENWQSEYLQFTLYIFATIWLIQR